MKWSYSGLSLYQTCPRKFWYSKVRRWEPVFDGFPKPVGSAVGAGLRVYWQGGSVGEAIHAATERFNEAVPEELLTQPELLEERRKAAAQVAACVTAYPWKHEQLTTVASEMRVNGTLNGVEIEGYIDRVVDVNGGLWVHETKTTGLGVDKVAAQLRLSYQLAKYKVLAEQQGLTVEGVLIEIIGKPRVYERKDGTMTVQDPKYLREPIHVGGQQVEELEHALGAIAFVEETDGVSKFPMAPGACLQFNRLCPFYRMCQLGPRRAEQLVDGVNYRVRPVREEAVAVAQDEAE